MFEIKNKKVWGIVIAYGLFAVLFHVFWLEMWGGDDAYFVTCLEDTTFWDFMAKRWNEWSSRLIIEGVMVLVLQFSYWVWNIMDILMSVLIAYMLTGMLFHKKRENIAVTAAALLLLLFSYDFHEMSSAGWRATTINYWWTLAMGLTAFLPLYFRFRGERVKTSLYIICVPALLYAVNHEQMATIFFLISVYMAGFFRWKKERLPKYLWLVFFLSAVSLILIFVCPGNEARKIANTEYWFPLYAEFNLLQKGLLGWYGVLRTLFEDVNWIFFSFTGILFLAVCRKCRKWYQIAFSAVPFCANLGLLAMQIVSEFVTVGKIEKILHVFDFDQPILYYQGQLPNKIRLLLLIYTICCFCVIAALFFLWENTEMFYHMLAILTIGAISKFSMGASPTVWASWERTSVFLLFALIVIGVCCAQTIRLPRIRKGK